MLHFASFNCIFYLTDGISVCDFYSCCYFSLLHHQQIIVTVIDDFWFVISIAIVVLVHCTITKLLNINAFEIYVIYTSIH